MYIYITEMHNILGWISFGLFTKLRKRLTHDRNDVQTCNIDYTPQSKVSFQTQKDGKQELHHKEGALKLLRRRSLSPFKGRRKRIPANLSMDSGRTLVERGSSFENYSNNTGSPILYRSERKQLTRKRISTRSSMEIKNVQQGSGHKFKKTLLCPIPSKKQDLDTQYQKSDQWPAPHQKNDIQSIPKISDQRNNYISRQLPDIKESRKQVQYLAPFSTPGGVNSRSGSIVSSITSENTINNIKIVFDNHVMPGVPSSGKMMDYDITND